MKTRLCIVSILSVFAVFAPFAETAAQKMPERRLVRKGNRQFARERYDKSIESYTRALEAAPTSFEASYDLANAMFRAERYDSAEQTLKSVLADSTRSDIDRSEAVYNLGNAQFAQQKLKEALASYRAAMRLNPDDQEAKYNYAYTKHLLQQQEQQEQQEQQQNDKNKDDKNEEQQSQDNRQESDDGQNDSQNDPQQGGEQNRPQDGASDDRSESEGQPQPQSGISEQEREAMLEAIQAQEDKTQDKLKEKTGVLVRGGKNW